MMETNSVDGAQSSNLETRRIRRQSLNMSATTDVDGRRYRRLSCWITIFLMVSVSQLIIGHYVNIHNFETQYFSSIPKIDHNQVFSSSNRKPVHEALDQFRPQLPPPIPGYASKWRKKPNLRKESLNNVKQMTLDGAELLVSTEKTTKSEKEIDKTLVEKMDRVIESPKAEGTDPKPIAEDHVLKVLRNANVEITPELKRNVPPYADFESMYGSTPIILGLEHCQTFRDKVPAKDRLIGPAGMFNTGTNLLYTTLDNNCVNEDRTKAFGKQSKGMQWQAPWGKHSPISYRKLHFAKSSQQIDVDHFMPVAIIKDPFTWMTSMCRHAYAANWKRDPVEHCPNLVPNQVDYNKFGKQKYDDNVMQKGISVSVQFNPNITNYQNLADLWNTWYGNYVDLDTAAHGPRLMIRFEDLLLHAETIIPKICECVGGTMQNNGKYKYTVDSAKGTDGAHKGASGLSEAIQRYVSLTKRVEKFTEEDLQFSNQHLNQTLMNIFHYSMPALNVK